MQMDAIDNAYASGNAANALRAAWPLRMNIY